MSDPAKPALPTPQSRVRGIPIAAALALATGLLTLLTIAVVLWVGYDIARRNTGELVQDKGSLIVRALVERVDRHLEPVQAQLRYLAEAFEDRPSDPADHPALVALLEGSLAAVPQVSAVALVTPQMRVYRAFRNRPDRKILISDWRDDDPFQAMVKEGARHDDLFWGGFFVAETLGLPYLNLGLAIRRNGAFAGLLLASISIAELSGFLDDLSDADLGTSFILYDRVTVLAHPALRDGFKGVTDEKPLPSLAQLPDPVLAALPASRPFLLPGQPDDMPADLRIVSQNGRDYLFVMRERTGFGEHRWTLGSYLPLAEAAPQLARLDTLLKLGLGLLAVAVLAAVLLGRWLARPIEDLALAAARVQELDLDDVPRIRGGPFRELRRAARSFNGMLAALRMFDNYVPRQLVLRLMREGRGGPLPSEEREVTIMFTDLAGFTTLAERLPAAEVAAILNRHFRTVDDHVEATGGVLDKYIGDAVMAFWGAPDAMPDHARRACAAGAAIADAMRRDNAVQAAGGAKPLRLRIGLHTGRVVVGDVGAPGRLNYTVVGDAVNVAQRLEELAGDQGENEGGADGGDDRPGSPRPTRDDVLVFASEATVRQAGPFFVFDDIGPQLLRGRRDSLRVFRLVGEVPSSDATVP